MKSSNEWISISDMMAGLMMVFLFIAVLYMVQIKDSIRCMKHPEKFQKEVEDLMERYDNYNKQIYAQLKGEFDKELKVWNAELDKENLTMSFSPDMIFSPGNSGIKKEFQIFLNNFCPRYFKTLYVSRDNIREIRIEGHTSSEWNGVDILKKGQAYFLNMRLSQDRTRSVLEYCMSLFDNNETMQEWTMKKVTANGLSSSRPKCEYDTVRCRTQNRRVEFQVQTNETAVLKQIRDKLNNLLAQLEKCKKV